MCGPVGGALIGGLLSYGGASWAGLTGAAMYGAVSAGVMSGMTAGSQYEQQRISFRNQQAQVTSNTLQYYRDLEFKQLQQEFKHKQFAMDLGMKVMQAKGNHAQFMQDMQFRQEQLAYEIMQREGQIEAANLDYMSKLDYAEDTMVAAWEAAETDMDLLNDQWNQIKSQATLDMFERKRQAMKEQSSIRVSQGESGIFGNTALKELANSVMQESWDRGILKWNLTNQGKQLQAQTKKIKATAQSRTNEALSGVVNRYLTGTAMNPAVAGIQI